MQARRFSAALVWRIVVVGIMAVVVPCVAQAQDDGVPGFAGSAATPVGTYAIGNATGPDPAVAWNGSSKLGIGIPFQTVAIDNYMVAGTCPWVAPALQAEGFKNTGAGANWNIVYQPLQGNDIALETYAPWVNNQPAIKQGNLTVAASASQGYGGAAIGLAYYRNNAADPDPTKTYLNWIQVVATNQPSAFGTGNANGVNVGGGNTAYIDNGYLSNAGNGYNGPVPSNPFYGGLNSGTGAYAGNGSNFIDAPSRQLANGVQWQAQVFLASWTPNDDPATTPAAKVRADGGTITIYDGVWWGFQLAVPAIVPPGPPVTPEPTTMLMWSAFLGLAVSVNSWKRRKKTNAA